MPLLMATSTFELQKTLVLLSGVTYTVYIAHGVELPVL